MKHFLNAVREMRSYLLLCSTQLISGLGSAMTAYALVIWSYSQEGSALLTALLMVCTYATYVLCSLFAGALSDRWDKKKSRLACDALAAMCTLFVLILLKTDRLRIGHLYLVNAVLGLMNTIQQPASEVAVTALLPRKHYQKVGGMRSLSSSVNAILTPIIATALLGLSGMDAVILIDLVSFAAAFLVLLFFIPIPRLSAERPEKESLLRSAGQGVRWLQKNPGIFHLILFLAAINLVASMYSAAFPAMMLSRPNAGKLAMGVVNAVIGVTSLAGCLLEGCFGTGKGSGAAFFFAVLWLMGIGVCLLFRKDRHIWQLDERGNMK